MMARPERREYPYYFPYVGYRTERAASSTEDAEIIHSAREQPGTSNRLNLHSRVRLNSVTNPCVTETPFGRAYGVCTHFAAAV
jgi:hypothetical protein